jgi:hypothetical protein
MNYYFALWMCDAMYSGVRLVGYTSPSADAPLGTKIYHNEYLVAAPFLAGTQIILEKTADILSATSAHIAITATYYVNDRIISLFGTQAGTMGWNSTTVAATTVVEPNGTLAGCYFDPSAYVPDDCYNYIDPYTPFHRARCSHLTIEYDAVTVVDEATPGDTLWTHYSPRTMFDGAVLHSWSVNFPAASIRQDSTAGHRSIRAITVNAFGDACLVQTCDWLKGIRVLISRDRFRTFTIRNIGTLGPDEGFYEWAGALWHTSVTGWRLFYALHKQMMSCDYRFGTVGNISTVGSGGVHQMRLSGTGDATMELFELEQFNRQANVHPMYGETVLYNAGTVSTTYGISTTFGTPIVSTAFASDYWIQAMYKSNGWVSAGTSTYAGGVRPGESYPNPADDIANPRYWLSGCYCPSSHPVLGYDLHSGMYNNYWHVANAWNHIGPSVWATDNSNLHMDIIFKLYAGDGYWYGIRDENIYESPDGIVWTCINRIPDWYTP